MAPISQRLLCRSIQNAWIISLDRMIGFELQPCGPPQAFPAWTRAACLSLSSRTALGLDARSGCHGQQYCRRPISIPLLPASRICQRLGLTVVARADASARDGEAKGIAPAAATIRCYLAPTSGRSAAPHDSSLTWTRSGQRFSHLLMIRLALLPLLLIQLEITGGEFHWRLESGASPAKPFRCPDQRSRS
jgi:hypothetical protein